MSHTAQLQLLQLLQLEPGDQRFGGGAFEHFVHQSCHLAHGALDLRIFLGPWDLESSKRGREKEEGHEKLKDPKNKCSYCSFRFIDFEGP